MDYSDPELHDKGKRLDTHSSTGSDSDTRTTAGACDLTDGSTNANNREPTRVYFKGNDVKVSKVDLTGGSPVTEHSFSYLHTEEEEQEKSSKSIFDIHRKNLLSLGNQRCSLSGNASPDETSPKSSSPHLHINRKLPPHLLYTVISDNSTSEDSDPGSDPGRLSATKSPQIQVRSRAKKLYDYSDPAYLEKTRRARRRKRSEVDIEVGLRLSRFVTRPYEGAADKYSGQKGPKQRQSKPKKQSTHNKSPLASSNETSPVGSVERVDKPRAQTAVYGNRLLPDFQRSRFQNSQRLSRRRSISVSPPRTQSAPKTKQIRRLFGSQSQHPSPLTSPGTSPPGSIGPSSPALLRYRRSTFKNILSLPTEAGTESFNLPLHHVHDENKPTVTRILPLIQSTSRASQTKTAVTSQKNHTSSLVEVCDRLAKIKNQSNSEAGEKMTKGSGKSKKTSNKEGSPQPQSPGSVQKRVLLNTSLPAGSPTFQRAMKGLRPPEVSMEEPSGDAIKQIPPMSKKPRVRISSAGGRRVFGKKSPLAGKSKRPPSENDNKSPDPDFDTTIAEIRDKLGNLGTGMGTEPPMPKSILKNRRRSIDDLDVGTKKGLSLYLKSKQMENSNLISTTYR